MKIFSTEEMKYKNFMIYINYRHRLFSKELNENDYVAQNINSGVK